MKKNILIILSFIVVSVLLFQITKKEAILAFEEKVISASGTPLIGQVHYATTSPHSDGLKESYILRTDNKFQNIRLPISHRDTKHIRLDPLPSSGEVIVKNFSIIQGSWLNTKEQNINLNDINLKKLKNIEIIKQKSNLLHLRATGTDPHMEISNKIKIPSSVIDYKNLIQIGIISLLIILFFKYILNKIQLNYLKCEDVLVAASLIIYSVYTILYAIQHIFASTILTFIPIFSLFIIYKNGIANYAIPLRNILISLFVLGLVSFIIDSVNDTKLIDRYFNYFQDTISMMLITLLFIQKKEFNFSFYKKFLTSLTIFIAIFTILLHYHIITVDTIITYGYRMSMSAWAQKNYTFWYLILMWGTISFLHFNKENKKDLFTILVILIFSSVMIFSGYSDSAKLSFVISVGIYLLFSIIKIHLNWLLLIPFIFSLYFLLTPWISDLYSNLSYLHPRLGGREAMFTVYSSLIKENLWFGYGFNSCITLIPTDFLSPEIIDKYSQSKWLKVCAPHTLPLILWLNFGLLGISIFSLLIYFSLKKLIILTYNHNNQAALVAHVASFTIITSFSWGSWYPYALLTYSFFLGTILLSLNINHKDNTLLKKQKVSL